MKMSYNFMTKQFGKPSTPMTVFSARMPTAFTMLAASGGTSKQIKISNCSSPIPVMQPVDKSGVNVG